MAAFGFFTGLSEDSTGVATCRPGKWQKSVPIDNLKSMYTMTQIKTANGFRFGKKESDLSELLLDPEVFKLNWCVQSFSTLAKKPLQVYGSKVTDFVLFATDSLHPPAKSCVNVYLEGYPLHSLCHLMLFGQGLSFPHDLFDSLKYCWYSDDEAAAISLEDMKIFDKIMPKLKEEGFFANGYGLSTKDGNLGNFMWYNGKDKSNSKKLLATKGSLSNCLNCVVSCKPQLGLRGSPAHFAKELMNLGFTLEDLKKVKVTGYLPSTFFVSLELSLLSAAHHFGGELLMLACQLGTVGNGLNLVPPNNSSRQQSAEMTPQLMKQAVMYKNTFQACTCLNPAILEGLCLSGEKNNWCVTYDPKNGPPSKDKKKKKVTPEVSAVAAAGKRVVAGGKRKNVSNPPPKAQVPKKVRTDKDKDKDKNKNKDKNKDKGKDKGKGNDKDKDKDKDKAVDKDDGDDDDDDDDDYDDDDGGDDGGDAGSDDSDVGSDVGGDESDVGIYTDVDDNESDGVFT